MTAPAPGLSGPALLEGECHGGRPGRRRSTGRLPGRSGSTRRSAGGSEGGGSGRRSSRRAAGGGGRSAHYRPHRRGQAPGHARRLDPRVLGRRPPPRRAIVVHHRGRTGAVDGRSVRVGGGRPQPGRLRGGGRSRAGFRQGGLVDRGAGAPGPAGAAPDRSPGRRRALRRRPRHGAPRPAGGGRQRRGAGRVGAGRGRRPTRHPDPSRPAAGGDQSPLAGRPSPPGPPVPPAQRPLRRSPGRGVGHRPPAQPVAAPEPTGHRGGCPRRRSGPGSRPGRRDLSRPPGAARAGPVGAAVASGGRSRPRACGSGLAPCPPPITGGDDRRRAGGRRSGSVRRDDPSPARARPPRPPGAPPGAWWRPGGSVACGPPSRPWHGT
jgi:hypothetical protein